MGPGMPGFGIASIFYIAAALLSPFFEVIRIAKGTSTPERRRTAASQFVIGLLMIGALVGFYVGLGYLMGRGWLGGADQGRFGSLPNWMYAVLTLMVVLGVGHVWGALARRFGAPERPSLVARAHSDGVARIVLDLRDESVRREAIDWSGSRSTTGSWKVSDPAATSEEVVGLALLFMFPPDPTDSGSIDERVAPLELAA